MQNKTSEQTDIEWIKDSLQRIEIRLADLEAFKWKVVGISGFVVLVIEVIFHGK